MRFVSKGDCPVCLANKDVTELECGHDICDECGKKWFKKSSKCPLCNEELTRKIIHEDFDIPLEQETTVDEEVNDDLTQDLLNEMFTDLTNMFNMSIHIVRQSGEQMHKRMTLVDAYMQYAVTRRLPPIQVNTMVNDILSGNI